MKIKFQWKFNNKEIVSFRQQPNLPRNKVKKLLIHLLFKQFFYLLPCMRKVDPGKLLEHKRFNKILS
jgi:hypothetical protein